MTQVQLWNFRLTNVPGVNMFPSKVMRVLILQKKLLERQDGGAFECLEIELARLMGYQWGSEQRLPHSTFFMFHALNPKFPYENGNFLGRNIPWLSDPGGSWRSVRRSPITRSSKSSWRGSEVWSVRPQLGFITVSLWIPRRFLFNTDVC